MFDASDSTLELLPEDLLTDRSRRKLEYGTAGSEVTEEARQQMITTLLTWQKQEAESPLIPNNNTSTTVLDFSEPLNEASMSKLRRLMQKENLSPEQIEHICKGLLIEQNYY
ncbi:hypothetical protein KJ652_01605 [Patescibacteria group bacterium]|nr:hypothetical protein [Patescibacteria group bacterium]MBU1123264.1 hypothetical protein [Patescibacteria group bacterium]MBU1911675.1 hypothetical protein [Patescibacteria group bacterium]